MSDDRRDEQPEPPAELWGLTRNGEWLTKSCRLIAEPGRDLVRMWLDTVNGQSALIGVSPARLAAAEARAEKAEQERDALLAACIRQIGEREYEVIVGSYFIGEYPTRGAAETAGLAAVMAKEGEGSK